MNFYKSQDKKQHIVQKRLTKYIKCKIFRIEKNEKQDYNKNRIREKGEKVYEANADTECKARKAEKE